MKGMPKKVIRSECSRFEIEVLDDMEGIARIPVGDDYDYALDTARVYQEEGRFVSIWGTNKSGKCVFCKHLKPKFYWRAGWGPHHCAGSVPFGA